MSRLQLNLIPDIKASYIKQERTRNLVVTGAFLVTGVCLAILLLMMTTVYGVQKKQLSNSDQDIKTSTTQLKAVENLDQILTVQSQLSSLVSLHQSKHITSRLFDYLTKVTPSNVSIGHVSFDLDANSLQIDGTADRHRSVNVFIDTLKYTSFKLGKTAVAQPAFSEVTESSFGLSQTIANYTVGFKFNPLLFANNQVDSQGRAVEPTLLVPNQTTNRTSLDDPSNVLFNGQNTKGTRQ